MRSFVPFSAIALILGITFAAVPLQSNFQLLNKYQFNADIVYIYVKIFDVGSNVTGLLHDQMLTYLVVANVTNPTDQTIKMRDIRVIFGIGGAFVGGGMFWGVDTYRYFPQGDFSYFWQPGHSIIVTLSGMMLTNIKELQTHWTGPSFTAGSSIELTGFTDVGVNAVGAYATSGIVSKQLSIAVVNGDEYVYNAMSGAPRFFFDDWQNPSTGIGIETHQVGQ